jgi:hypothetical protein
MRFFSGFNLLKCRKLQTNKEIHISQKYSTLENTKYLIWQLKLSCKGMSWKCILFGVLFLAVVIRSDISEECIVPSFTVLLDIVWVGDEFEGKSLLATMECCEGIWPIRNAELFRMPHYLLSCNKRRVGCNKDLNIDANINFKMRIN